MKRRDFISFISASLASLSVSCNRPEHKIVPAVNPSEFSKPGNPVYFNTAFQLKNCSYGVTVKTIDGKPIKIDGNPSHPSTNGVINPLIQGSLFSLYDPKRFFPPQINGSKKTKEESSQLVIEKIQTDLAHQKQIFIFINEHCSPSYQNLIERIKEKSDLIKFIRFSPFKSILSNVNKQVFDVDAEFVPDFDKAEYVITFDADILGTNKLSSFFTRKLTGNRSPIKRLICVESNHTLTGIYSDERYALPPNAMYDLVKEIYLKIIHKGNDLSSENLESNALGIIKKLSDKFCEDLFRFGTKSVLIPGENTDWYIAKMIMLINNELQNIGEDKVFNPNYVLPFSNYYTDPEKEFISGSFSTGIDCTVIFLETNPFYSGNNFLKKRLAEIKSGDLISLTLYPDETYQRAGIKLPAAHYLEKWGDTLFFDGNQSIIQPVIKPLNEESLSSEEFLLKLLQSFETSEIPYNSYYDYLREFYNQSIKNRNDWDSALRNGYFSSNNTLTQRYIKPRNIKISKFLNSSDNEFYYLQIVPSINFYDDYEPNNPYLLELPDPISKITWENAAYIAESTALKNKLANGDVVQLFVGMSKIEIPIYVVTGIADKTIVISSGFGRKIRDSEDLFGVNPYVLINFEFDEFSLSSIPVKLEKTNKKVKFAQSQTQFKTNDNLIPNPSINKKSIYPGYQYLGQKWGMLIDLTKCTGCNSCVISCQFENNIPFVGKKEVLNGRLMHWIKIDRYNSDDNENTHFEPMFCQHCDNAPCESVCPVGATSHSPEGINEMTYNRCIGARFCMVNCPYNIRKFNYENYFDSFESPLENMLNPEITVRMRGIAEKCTFCVHRINELRIDSNSQGQKHIPDEKLKTACQEACPSHAIIFGDLNNKNSLLSKLKEENQFYHKLEFLNTKPSVAYVKKQGRGTDII